MNLPMVFDVAIGIVFIYLVLSLLSSQIQEVLATLLQWRAKHLKGAIEHLISGDRKDTNEKLLNELFNHPLIQDLNQTSDTGMAKMFRGLGAIKQSNPSRTSSESNSPSIPPLSNTPSSTSIPPSNRATSSSPAYIPAETFSSTILKQFRIPEASRLLTWLNIKKLVFYEIELKLYTLLKKTKGFDPAQEQSFKTLKAHLKEVLEDYKEERYVLPATLIRLRNQVENFKREITEICPIETTPNSAHSSGDSKIDPKNKENKLLRDSINQIIESIFTQEKDDSDLLSRIKPRLTTVLDLMNKDSSTYKSFQAEKANMKTDKDLVESFNEVDKKFEEIAEGLPTNLRSSLDALALRACIKASDVEQQIDHFKQEIETWFDRSMDRSTGVYKRNARGFAFIIGFILAFALNVDTFYIVSRLSKDDALRNSIVNNSSQFVQNANNLELPNPSPSLSSNSPFPSRQSFPSSPSSNPSPSPNSSSPPRPLSSVSRFPLPSSSPNPVQIAKYNVDQSLSDISLPIGWTDNIVDDQLKETPLPDSPEAKRKVRILGWYVPPMLVRTLGWLVTATAIMMGAPFWFDFLGLFINVRNTGGRPKSKTDRK